MSSPGDKRFGASVVPAGGEVPNNVISFIAADGIVSGCTEKKYIKEFEGLRIFISFEISCCFDPFYLNIGRFMLVVCVYTV